MIYNGLVYSFVLIQRSQFRQKKELAMKQIAELFANDPSNNMESRKEVCLFGDIHVFTEIM